MTLRITWALLAERAQRTWPLLVLALFVGIGFRTFFETYWLYQSGRDSDLVPAHLVMLSFAALCLLYTSTDSDRLSCGMPESLLRLPVSTLMLVATRFAFNLAAIVSLSLAFAWIERASTPDLNWQLYPISTALLFAILQLCAFAFGRLGDWSLAFIAGVPACLIAFTDMQWVPFPSAAASAAGIAACFVASWGIVFVQRRGAWDIASARRARRSKVISPEDTLIEPFTSPHSAQLWFECRRLLVYLPTIFGSLFLFALVFAVFMVEPRHGANRIELFLREFSQLLPLVTMVTAFAIGTFMVFQNFRLQTGSMASFYFLRPYSTRNLGTMRVAAGILGVLAIAILGYVLPFAISEFSTSSLSVGMPLVAQMIVSIWMVFWIVNGVLVLAGTTLYEGVDRALSNQQIDVESLPLYALFLLLVSVLFYAAHRKRLVSWPAFIPIFAVAVALQIPLLSNLGHVIPSNFQEGGGPLDQFMMGVCGVFVLVAPIATVPLIINWCRHRR